MFLILKEGIFCVAVVILVTKEFNKLDVKSDVCVVFIMCCIVFVLFVYCVGLYKW